MLITDPKPSAKIPAKHKALAAAMLSSAHTRGTIAEEISWFRDSAEEVRGESVKNPLPVSILSRGLAEWKGSPREKLKEQLWRELQERFLLLAPRTSITIADQSGHQIHLDQPRLVADKIVELRALAQNSFVAAKLPNGIAEPVAVQAGIP